MPIQHIQDAVADLSKCAWASMTHGRMQIRFYYPPSMQAGPIHGIIILLPEHTEIILADTARNGEEQLACAKLLLGAAYLLGRAQRDL